MIAFDTAWGVVKGTPYSETFDDDAWPIFEQRQALSNPRTGIPFDYSFSDAGGQQISGTDNAPPHRAEAKRTLEWRDSHDGQNWDDDEDEPLHAGWTRMQHPLRQQMLRRLAEQGSPGRGRITQTRQPHANDRSFHPAGSYGGVNESRAASIPSPRPRSI